MTAYTEKELREMAARMKRNARKSVLAQGFEPVFESGYEIRIGDCVALTVWWIQDGIRQCANCAI